MKGKIISALRISIYTGLSFATVDLYPKQIAIMESITHNK
jgi:hypothetical protein